MANTFGKVVADAVRPGQPGKPPFKGPTLDTLMQRKLQEMRREIARLGAAIQRVEHEGRALAAGGDVFAYIRASDELGGWILSLLESKAYLEALTDGGSADFEGKVRQVMAVGKRRAQAEQLLVSRS